MQHTPSVLAISLALTASAAMADSCSVRSPAHRVALIELYTSQGCSSCPPADRWLSVLGQRVPDTQAIPLSMHVGYWDYIGWKDPFAKREFNERQRAWATANGSRSVYTPGVFVQGRELRDWSSSAALGASLRASQSMPAGASLSLAGEFAAGRLTVDVKASAVAGQQTASPELRLALVQSGLQTAVRAGENRGEQLANDHVVREWSAALPLGCHRTSFTLPAGARPQDWAVVALVQSEAGGEILQALRWSKASCKG